MPTHIQKHNEKIAIPLKSRLLFVNVGEPNRIHRRDHENRVSFHTHRKWENSLKYGFVSGGQIDVNYGDDRPALRWRWINSINSVQNGDIICAYVTEVGFVGIGTCTAMPTIITELILPDGKFLSTYANELHQTFLFKTQSEVNQMGFARHIPNTYGCEQEYGFPVKWIRSLTRNEVQQTNQNKLGTLGITQHVVSNMQTVVREKMVNFVEEIFNVEFKSK